MKFLEEIMMSPSSRYSVYMKRVRCTTVIVTLFSSTNSCTRLTGTDI